MAGGGRRTEDEREPARRLVVEHLLECDDVRMRRQPAQRLPGSAAERRAISAPWGALALARARRTWISRRLLTWSILSKWFFMHLIAWYLPSFTFCALSTSLNVPSPFFATSRYLRISHRARTPLAASHCPSHWTLNRCAEVLGGMQVQKAQAPLLLVPAADDALAVVSR